MASGNRKAIRSRSIIVSVSESVYGWPGHLNEILDKMGELEAIIDSIETGRTQRLT
jgi:hypothetical protein